MNNLLQTQAASSSFISDEGSLNGFIDVLLSVIKMYLAIEEFDDDDENYESTSKLRSHKIQDKLLILRVRSVNSKSFIFGYDFIFSSLKKVKSYPNIQLLQFTERTVNNQMWC